MNAQHNNSGNNKSGGNRNRKNFRRNNNKNNGPNKNNNNRNRNRNSQNKNRRPKSLTPARIIQKYDNLLEQHIIARKKYFELHARVKGKQLDKIEQNLQKTLHDLRNFEAGLKDWQKEVLTGKVDQYAPDRQYSTSREIEPVGDNVSFVGDFEDPHLLATQTETDWSEDTEESSGSMEEYYAYKGIEPPTPEEIEEKEKKKHRRQ